MKDSNTLKSHAIHLQIKKCFLPVGIARQEIKIEIEIEIRSTYKTKNLEHNEETSETFLNLTPMTQLSRCNPT